MQRPCPERGHEPPHDSRPDALGDQGVQESGHRRPRHASLDATQRAGGRVIADGDEHGIGCQISNALERVAQVGLDDDRVRPSPETASISASSLSAAATTSNPLVPS